MYTHAHMYQLKTGHARESPAGTASAGEPRPGQGPAAVRGPRERRGRGNGARKAAAAPGGAS